MRKHESRDLYAAVNRFLQALVRRAAEGDENAVIVLAALEDRTREALHDGVTAWRAFTPAHNAPPNSWTDVGKLLGVTRQSAQGRFGA